MSLFVKDLKEEDLPIACLPLKIIRIIHWPHAIVAMLKRKLMRNLSNPKDMEDILVWGVKAIFQR